jgi:cyclic pyranopterin phosphate synthase
VELEKEMRALYLRLSVTERCNLKCTYCKPASSAPAFLPPSPLNDEELVGCVEALHQAAPVGKIRLTGGEPLLRPGLPQFIHRLRQRFPAAHLGLTTNGTLLDLPYAKALKLAGLQRINISLDSIDSKLFSRLTGGGQLQEVERGIEAAQRAGFDKIKLNAVLLRSINAHQILELVRFAAERRCQLRFIELMPLGAAARLFERERFSALAAQQVLAERLEHLGHLAQQGTAQLHLFRDGPQRLVVGFIAPLSHPFCTSCNRFRINAQGQLFSCLRQDEGLSLLPRLAHPHEELLLGQIQHMIAAKIPVQVHWPERPMVAIGG